MPVYQGRNWNRREVEKMLGGDMVDRVYNFGAY